MTSQIWKITQDEHTTPFEKEWLLRTHKGRPAMLADNHVPKAHQTLIVVNVCATPHENQRERAQRFVACFNSNQTIKADIVSAADGKLAEGLVWFGANPGGVDAQQIAINQGYTQVVELDYVGAGSKRKPKATTRKKPAAPAVEKEPVMKGQTAIDIIVDEVPEEKVALPDKDKPIPLEGKLYWKKLEDDYKISGDITPPKPMTPYLYKDYFETDNTK